MHARSEDLFLILRIMQIRLKSADTYFPVIKFNMPVPVAMGLEFGILVPECVVIENSMKRPDAVEF